jgi:hypothetical protein
VEAEEVVSTDVSSFIGGPVVVSRYPTNGNNGPPGFVGVSTLTTSTSTGSGLSPNGNAAHFGVVSGSSNGAIGSADGLQTQAAYDNDGAITTNGNGVVV